mgnify:FL=1
MEDRLGWQVLWTLAQLTEEEFDSQYQKLTPDSFPSPETQLIFIELGALRTPEERQAMLKSHNPAIVQLTPDKLSISLLLQEYSIYRKLGEKKRWFNASSGERPPSIELLKSLEQEIRRIVEENPNEIGVLLPVNERYKEDEILCRVETPLGFLECDIFNRYLILAGAPGEGKTTLALTSVKHYIQQDLNCYYITLENSAPIIFNRLAYLMQTQPQTLFKDKAAKHLFIESNLIFIEDIINIVEKMTMPAVLYIDYFQLLKTRAVTNRETSNQYFSYISGELRRAVSRYPQLSLVVLSQLSRRGEALTIPTLDTLKETGSLEADADIVIAISRNRSNPEEAAFRRIITVLKNRHGALSAPRDLIFENGMFVELAESDFDAEAFKKDN